jgi:hypothetical protein
MSVVRLYRLTVAQLLGYDLRLMQPQQLGTLPAFVGELPPRRHTAKLQRSSNRVFALLVISSKELSGTSGNVPLFSPLRQGRGVQTARLGTHGRC